MRTSIGLLTGIAAIGLLACTETIVQHTGGPAPDGTQVPGSETNGTDPSGTDPSQQGDPTSTDSPSPPLVAGLAIKDIAVFQGVKVPVVTDGKVVKSRNAPVVASRQGLVRVYVTPGSGYSAQEVTAELRLVDGTTRLPVVKDTKTITKASTDEDLKSTFNFEIPATSLPKTVSYQIFLTAKGGTVATNGANDARFPKNGGVQSLDAEASGKVKVVIVPVQYDADGSGRVPDTSASQLALYKQTFMARYPAQDVDVTAHAPWSWTTAISGNGSGFSQVLNGITNLRKQDGVGADVYYYGALAPRSSFNTFCGGGCVTGLSSVADERTSFLRASVGIGFSGPESANTAAHEVGHAHGRNHAPCGGAQGVDPDFPYSGGVIGVWGYDIFAKTFLSPSKGHDMMGYCPNEWVSDYTFTALFDRIALLNGNPATKASGSSTGSSSSQAVPAARATQTYRMSFIDEKGNIEDGGTIDLDEAPGGGELRAATFVSIDGHTLGQRDARFYAYDHLPGGVLVMPAGTGDAKIASWSTIHVSGIARSFTR